MNNQQAEETTQEAGRSKKKLIAFAIAGALVIGGGVGAFAYAGVKADREATRTYVADSAAFESRAVNEADSVMGAHTQAKDDLDALIQELEAVYSDSEGKVENESDRDDLRSALDVAIALVNVDPQLVTEQVVVEHARFGDTDDYPRLVFDIPTGTKPASDDLVAAGREATAAADKVAVAIDAFFAGKLAEQITSAETVLKDSAKANKESRTALENAIKDAKGDVVGESAVTAAIKSLKEAANATKDSHDKAVKTEADAQAKAEREAAQKASQSQAQRQATSTGSTNSRPATSNSSANKPATSNNKKPAASTGGNKAPATKPTTQAPVKPKPTTQAPVKPKPTTPAPKPTTQAPVQGSGITVEQAQAVTWGMGQQVASRCGSPLASTTASSESGVRSFVSTYGGGLFAFSKSGNGVLIQVCI